MDGLGYNNWENKNNAYDDDQSDSSPPVYTSDSYGFSAEASPQGKRKSVGKAKASKNLYDYNIEEDDYNYGSSPEPVKSKYGKDYKSASGSGQHSSQPARRKTTEERMKEILDRNDADKKAARTASELEDVGTSTWKSSWDNIIEGVGSADGSKEEEDDEEEASVKSPNLPRSKNVKDEDVDHSLSDSSFGDFEISASDLEVHLTSKHANYFVFYELLILILTQGPGCICYVSNLNNKHYYYHRH